MAECCCNGNDEVRSIYACSGAAKSVTAEVTEELQDALKARMGARGGR